MSTLLIIGGTGFFGKSFLDSFQRGQLDQWGVDRVIAMSRNADRLRIEAPELLDERVELVNADIGVTDWLPSADFVIHAAASTDAKNYLTQPENEQKNILSAVDNYCRIAPTYHPFSKIVYVSSGAIYGKQPDSVKWIHEEYSAENYESLPNGKQEYALGKRSAEELFKKLGEIGLRISTARCFTFVGRWLPLDKHFAIGNFIACGLNAQPIVVNATNRVIRSYMHSDELVEWIMRIANNSSENNPTYNVGSDFPIEIGDVAGHIANYFNLPMVRNSTNINQVDRYVPSIEKIKKELGLEIKINLNKAIEQTISEKLRCFR